MTPDVKEGDSVDLSSFPLLRIDQIQYHETQTLVKAEIELSEIQNDSMDALDSISPFITKLINNVREELAHRQRTPTRRAIADDGTALSRTTHRYQQRRPNSPTTTDTSSRQPSFFVSNSPKNTKQSSNFRTRAKLAKASLQARSNEAKTRDLEQKRHERTRQALQTMQQKRMEREREKKQREELLSKEREHRRQKWKEKRERETQLRDAMHTAAEEAKSKALELGRTNDEAVVEAAAAAAKVVDDCGEDDENTDTESDADDSFAADVEESTDIIDSSVAQHGDICTNALAEAGDNLSRHENTTFADEEEHVDICESVSVINQAHDNCIGDAAGTAISDMQQHEKMEDNISVTGEESEDESSSCSQGVEEEESKSASITETPYDVETVYDSATPTTHDVNERRVCAPPINTNENDDDASATKSDNIDTTTSISTAIAQNEQLFLHTTTIDDNILIEEKEPTQTIAKSERKFCNIFSSFHGIFAGQVSSQKGSTADMKQREISKSLQHQVDQYTRTKAQFVDIKCSERSGDTDSDEDVDAFEEDISDAFDRGLFYRINSRRPEVASIIDKAFSNHQLLSAWEELPPDIEDSCWNLMWVWGLPKAADFDNLLVFQKINRFRNTRGLTRKDLLKKNIQQFSNKALATKRKQKDCDSYNIMPLTYALPHEFNAFVSGYQSIQKVCGNTSSSNSNIWIIKPVGLSRGRGISIVNDVSMVSYSQPIVIQRYISDPLCFMGFKFDLRIYVLVTSFSPLEAFIYKEGLARFGSKQYSLRPEFLNDHRIHLTNSSIQREFGNDNGDNGIDRSHPAYLAGSNGAGNKVAFTWLWKRLEGLGMDTQALWIQMVDVCHKALLAAGSDIPQQPNSFEIFGFDLMFDQSLKCWLIEVNSSPSLGCDSPLDTRIKGSLIRDSIALVNPPAYDRRVLADICKLRMTHRKSVSSVSCRDALEKDLAQILKNKVPRKFGEMPKMGNFERIVPTTSCA